MITLDIVFAVLTAGAVTLALRALVRMLGSAWGIDHGEGEGR